MIVVSIYLLPDRLLYNTINTVKQTTTRGNIIPTTDTTTEATTGTKTSVDLSSGMLLLVLLTPTLNNSYEIHVMYNNILYSNQQKCK